MAIQEIINSHWKVDFWTDDDAQNAVKNEIDDFFYDEIRGKLGVDLGQELMDEIIKKTMQLAKSREQAQ